MSRRQPDTVSLAGATGDQWRLSLNLLRNVLGGQVLGVLIVSEDGELMLVPRPGGESLLAHYVKSADWHFVQLQLEEQTA